MVYCARSGTPMEPARGANTLPARWPAHVLIRVSAGVSPVQRPHLMVVLAVDATGWLQMRQSDGVRVLRRCVPPLAAEHAQTERREADQERGDRGEQVQHIVSGVQRQNAEQVIRERADEEHQRVDDAKPLRKRSAARRPCHHHGPEQPRAEVHQVVQPTHMEDAQEVGIAGDEEPIATSR